MDKVVFRLDLLSFYSQARAIFPPLIQQICIPAVVKKTKGSTSFKPLKETFDCQTAA